MENTDGFRFGCNPLDPTGFAEADLPTMTATECFLPAAAMMWVGFTLQRLGGKRAAPHGMAP